MKTKPYDEYYRIQHRIVGHYLAIHAWLRELDCVVLDRKEIQAFLNIRNTGEDRTKQFTKDIEPWFKFNKPYYRKGSKTYVRSLFLSRIDISLSLPHGLMSTDDRIAKAVIADRRLRIERFSNSSQEVPSMKDIVSDLALFAAGLKIPSAIRNF
ncbi:MAG TPA: hypothetical protein VEY11_03515 [Pyrinomonadaceae bacterium]|nr:hypothetical protein [Pyrinomonadaceae bacterium]